MANFKYTQESAGNGRMNTDDFMDEFNLINEIRQVMEDLAAIIGHTKLGDGLYPKDGTAGLIAINVVKNNFSAGVIPTVDDDETDGYANGSIWIYDEKSYTCVDATEGAAVWIEITQSGNGGYTNLTEFVDQTAWRLFYSNADGDVIELALGTDGQYLKSTGVASAPIFDTPSGGGNVSTSGTPIANDYARFVDATTIEGRDYSEVKTDLSLNNVENLKVKLDATQAPTVNNDIDEGYEVGSRWFDITNDKEYVCLDNTDGAAVWIETTGGGGAGEANTVSNIGSEIEIYKQKTGVDLEFRTLKANSNKITISITPENGITIGRAAVERQYTFPIRTIVNKGAVANGTGKITSVEIWANSELSNCEVATFYVVSGNNLSTRDTHPIGTVTAGSKQTFSGLDIDVEAGDYLGIYYTAGAIEKDNTGSGLWHTVNDDIPCTNVEFSSDSGVEISLYGIGAVADLNHIKFDIVPSEIAPEIGGLLSTTIVAFNADADTILYTVPAGKRCVLTKAIIVAAGDAGATTTLSIGANGTETDFIPVSTLSNLDIEFDSIILQPIPNLTPEKIKSYAAATVIEAQVASQSGVAGNTIYLFGILY